MGRQLDEAQLHRQADARALRIVRARTTRRRDRVFTEREAAVLRLTRLGHGSKAVAHQLQMSESTARVHLANARRKLDEVGLADVFGV